MTHSDPISKAYSPNALGKLQFYCLIAAGALELLFMILGSLFNYVAYYYVETYLIVPCAAFFALSLLSKVPSHARKSIFLCLAMVVWFMVTQTAQRAQGMQTKIISMFFCTYLLAFPYASVTEDSARQRGLKWITGIYIAVSLVLCVYASMLYFDLLPDWFHNEVRWDGARLLALWHPNICACLFMIGIALCLGLFFSCRKPYGKALLIFACAVQFLFLALTNCRTSILMTCALIGGIFFFGVYRGGWLRAVLLAFLALLLMLGLFILSGTLYEANETALIEKYASHLESEDSEQAPAVSAPSGSITIPVKTDSQTGEVTLESVNGQGSFMSDLKTLNGRTTIWQSALNALRDNKRILLFGTEYVGTSISYYNPFPVVHGHNSWVEITFRTGLLGLIFALGFTWIGLRSAVTLIFDPKTDMWKKSISMLTLCVMVAGALEPFLFSADISYHFLDFFFFICLGYLDTWYHQRKESSGA